ncbi:MAG: hypothetical protein AB7R90_20735 [Reyranellaceae bacterium]
MDRRQSRRDNEEPWIVEGVSPAARAAAEQAADTAGTSLAIWLADTVLRATQEGVSELSESSD